MGVGVRERENPRNRSITAITRDGLALEYVKNKIQIQITFYS